MVSKIDQKPTNQDELSWKLFDKKSAHTDCFPKIDFAALLYLQCVHNVALFLFSWVHLINS